MLPSIRLVIAAIIATVVLMMAGFGLVATFQIAKTSIDAPARGASPRDPALADRLERNKVYTSTGTPRINEGALVVDMPSTDTASMATNLTPASRSDSEDAVAETPTNFGAASSTQLVSPSRSDNTGPDQTLGIVTPRERAPVVVALKEDAAPAIGNPSANAVAVTAPTVSSNGRSVGRVNPEEAPTINIDNTSAPTVAPAAILSTPDVAAAAAPMNPGHEAMDASPSHTVPKVGSSSPPVETTVAASPAGEMTTAVSPRTTADEIDAAPTPVATVAPNAESRKATATKGKRAKKATKPHTQAKKAKAHQATTSKAKVWVAAHVRRRSVRPDRQFTSQPQYPANPFGNFFSSQQVGRWPSAIGAAR